MEVVPEKGLLPTTLNSFELDGCCLVCMDNVNAITASRRRHPTRGVYPSANQLANIVCLSVIGINYEILILLNTIIIISIN